MRIPLTSALAALALLAGAGTAFAGESAETRGLWGGPGIPVEQAGKTAAAMPASTAASGSTVYTGPAAGEYPPSR